MITATQKLEIILSVIVLALAMCMIESGLTLALYSLTQNLILTEISIGVEVIATLFMLYLFFIKTNKSFMVMNAKQPT
ncbi:MAG: hypothetical protein ACPHY8_03335 [Patescibacteria group bacterium]